MQQKLTSRHILTGHKILKKPIVDKRIKGRNIMYYPKETTTWNIEIHRISHQQKWHRLAERERMLRIAKKNKKQQKPDLKRILEVMHIFLTLVF